MYGKREKNKIEEKERKLKTPGTKLSIKG